LVVDGRLRYLKPLNLDYRTIEASKDCVIVGVVKQVILDL